jgi:hypothetical protein
MGPIGERASHRGKCVCLCQTWSQASTHLDTPRHNRHHECQWTQRLDTVSTRSLRFLDTLDRHSGRRCWLQYVADDRALPCTPEGYYTALRPLTGAAKYAWAHEDVETRSRVAFDCE